MSGKVLRAEEEIRGPEMLRSEKFSMFGLPSGMEITHLLPGGWLGCPDDEHSRCS